MQQKPDDIEQIEKRIKNFRSVSQTKQPEKKFLSAYQVGTRIAADLVSGVLVGAGLGYLFDKMANSAPMMLIVFIILGGIAGFLNVYRFVKKQEQIKEEINV